MFNKIIIISLIFCSANVFAQNYRWQQEADYTMEIDMDVKSNKFDGIQSLVLTNNSPDNLNRVFYHLYFNAFQPNSMMDVRSRTIVDPDKRVGDRISKLEPKEYGYQKIISLTQDGRPVKFKVVGTILEVDLDHIILPGEKSKFDMVFEGQVPLQVRRSGRDGKEGVRYTMTQWYPKMCEYDEQGWHANPYVGREFYGIWGDFDVTIYIDRKYTIGGTGILQNPDDIGLGYSDRVKLPKKSKGRKAMWHFVANKVHDFAWAADDEYVHETYKTKSGILFHTFYKEGIETTDNWKKLPGIIDEAFEYINEHFGEYPYKQFSVIQGGDGGMEYPMCTMVTGNRPINSLVGVTVHELLHSWYHGVLATNEALYPWMDEGFVSYAESRVENDLKCKGLLEGDCQDRMALNHNRAVIGFHKAGRDEAICTHADHYSTNAAYSVASYGKGSVFLTQLEYIIGTEAFDRAMLRYYKEWQFRHPNPNDIIRVMEKESNMELDWFREYFVNSTNLPDYAVDTLSIDGTEKTIVLDRLGLMPMPIDVQVIYGDSTSSYHSIPLRIMRGEKTKENDIMYKVEGDWPWTHPSYSFSIATEKSIRKIIVDPSGRLADTDRSNNVYELME